MARVGLIFGGRSVEHRVSIVSARAVGTALVAAGHEVIALGIAEDGCWVDPAAARAALDGGVEVLPPLARPVVPTLRHLLAAEADVLFPLVHGTWGEDGTLQGLCEMLDLPFVGAGVTASALAMDKAQSKVVLRAAGIPVVDFEVVRKSELEKSESVVLSRVSRFALPLFIKPSVGGSSVGIRKVRARNELVEALAFAFRFDDVVIVEEGIVGRELECGVLGGDELVASEVGEIVPGGEFYDYAEKYLNDDAELIAPAELASDVRTEIQRVAVAAFAALGGYGLARVDFLLGIDGSLYLNELNTIPGFTGISMYPRLWSLSGLSMSALVDRLVNLAFERHDKRGQLDRGIRQWLDSL